MATNEVEIVGEDTSLVIFATNLTGADAVEFDSGAFVAGPEEMRKVVAFITIGNKVVKMTLKWRDPMFNITTITGAPLTSGKFQ